MKNDSSKKKINSLATGISLGLALGAGLGVAIGVAVNNIGLWMPVCIGCGVALGAGISGSLERFNKKKKY
jgi:hypothetical protein